MTDALAARKTHWRDNIEAIGAAIVLALLLKAFALEAYQIPTGSMQPTLLGYTSDTLRVSDRIVVDKFSYEVRDPERFDVAVFRYPLDRSKNFVKRIVGMPNEELKIESGDVWVRSDSSEPWTIARRPEDVQESHWKHLEHGWTNELGDVTVEGTDLVARGSGVARFGRDRSIEDRFFDGYPDFVRASVPRTSDGLAQPKNVKNDNRRVGDLRLAGDAVASADTVSIDLVLVEGPRTYRFRLPGPASTDADRPSIEIETQLGRGSAIDHGLPVRTPRKEADAPWRLPAGSAVRVEAENLDDRLALRIDGGPTLAVDVPPVTDQDSRVRVAFDGPGRFESARVWRDLYYTKRGTTHWSIPDESYVMLGDNTQDSSDGREWEFERYQVDANGATTILRGNKRSDENALRMDASNHIFFVDEWGQRHYLDTSSEPDPGFESATWLREPEPAPFVHRDLITGRAIAVFWPINPFKGYARLEWVD